MTVLKIGIFPSQGLFNAWRLFHQFDPDLHRMERPAFKMLTVSVDRNNGIRNMSDVAAVWNDLDHSSYLDGTCMLCHISGCQHDNEYRLVPSRYMWTVDTNDGRSKKMQKTGGIWMPCVHPLIAPGSNNTDDLPF